MEQGAKSGNASEKLMRKGFLGLAFCALLFALSASAAAQETKKVPQIGYLALLEGRLATEQAFQQGLRDLGYIDGQTVIIDYRFAGGKVDRLPELAEELVR